MTLTPAGRWDWWQIPLDWVQAMGPGIPGIVARANGTFEIHRTHLPLLQQHGLLAQLPEDTAAPAVDVVRGITLRPWQKRALTWAQPRRGSLIVAEPRLGKTATALLLHEPTRGPLMILSPLDVRQVWIDWIERVFPGANPLILEGQTIDVDAMRASSVIFGHYDIVSHQRLTSVQPGTLIVDEAHLLSNASSKRSEGVRFFAGNAARVITLTGTPLWNSVKGLWPILAATNPGAWGPKPFAFQQRYCSPVIGEYGWQYGEISNADEWLARRQEIVFEASWRGEHPDLPPTRRSFRDVAIDASAADELDIAAEALRDPLAGDAVISTITRYRKLTGMMKVPAAIATALEFDAPVVVWTWHQDVAKAIAKGINAAGRPAWAIHGGKGTPASLRHAAIAAWRDSSNGVLCATMAVGQVGIDLSHGRHGIAAEIDWTPAVMSQAEMREFDPARPMEMIYLRVQHPVEQLLVDKLLVKLARADASAMPAAGSSFSLSTTEESDDALLAALDALLLG